MSNIHQTAIIAPSAQIAETATVAPYCVIDEDVVIDENTTIGPHTVISKRVKIGSNNTFHGFCSIGDTPQHIRDSGVDCELIIGNGNTFREFCTLHRGTVVGGGKTVIGNNNFVMAYAHVAHDCILGDHIILVNNATLGGHVEVGDYAILGGLTLVHQWCKVGRHAFTGRMTALVQDLPPFTMATGSPAHTHALNLIGLQRRDFSNDLILALKKAYKHCVRKTLLMEPEQLMALANKYPEVKEMIDFIETSERGIVSGVVPDHCGDDIDNMSRAN